MSLGMREIFIYWTDADSEQLAKPEIQDINFKSGFIFDLEI
jgi:hypothetical protein